MSRQLIRQWYSRALPGLTQGSTLTIRSKAKNTNICIRPEWKDDGYLSVLHKQLEKKEPILQIFKHDDQMTSMGRHESHVSVHLDDDPTKSGSPFGKGKLVPAEEDSTDHGNIVVLDDATIVPDGPEWSPPPQGHERKDYSPGVAIIAKDDENKEAEGSFLSLSIPEKLNINCNLENGGSITIYNKIEGDAMLQTSNGNITVKKLRGHSLDLKVNGDGNSIYSSDLLEAGTLRISTPASGRLRVKRIHAGDCKIDIGVNDDASSVAEVESNEVFDVDDVGAVCDISSIYVTKDTTVNYVSSSHERQPVRIKSNHGHVIVDAASPKPNKINEMTGQTLPVVDLGGVNGSCEVYVREPSTQAETPQDQCTSCHVHFDSIIPDSVSILKADMGDVHMTIDRKVESDIRLLSASNLGSLDLDELLIDSEDEDFEAFKEMLKAVDESSSSTSQTGVSVKTMAFTEKPVEGLPLLENVQFLDGWVENKSAEPDSRFDRKIRGDSGSVGKIRLAGAESQALHGFQKPDDGRKDEFPRPIVAVASTGKIHLETLSWLGNIARRYGLDDKRETDDLGRTATRRGRSLQPTKE